MRSSIVRFYELYKGHSTVAKQGPGILILNTSLRDYTHMNN